MNKSFSSKFTEWFGDSVGAEIVSIVDSFQSGISNMEIVDIQPTCVFFRYDNEMYALTGLQKHSMGTHLKATRLKELRKVKRFKDVDLLEGGVYVYNTTHEPYPSDEFTRDKALDRKVTLLEKDVGCLVHALTHADRRRDIPCSRTYRKGDGLIYPSFLRPTLIDDDDTFTCVSEITIVRNNKDEVQHNVNHKGFSSQNGTIDYNLSFIDKSLWICIPYKTFIDGRIEVSIPVIILPDYMVDKTIIALNKAGEICVMLMKDIKVALHGFDPFLRAMRLGDVKIINKSDADKASI